MKDIILCGKEIRKELEKVCKGIRAEIASITFQEYWGDKREEKDSNGNEYEYGFYTEFTDTNGVYRNWKQYIDGGYVIPKKGR